MVDVGRRASLAISRGRCAVFVPRGRRAVGHRARGVGGAYPSPAVRQRWQLVDQPRPDVDSLGRKRPVVGGATGDSPATHDDRIRRSAGAHVCLALCDQSDADRPAWHCWSAVRVPGGDRSLRVRRGRREPYGGQLWPAGDHPGRELASDPAHLRHGFVRDWLPDRLVRDNGERCLGEPVMGGGAQIRRSVRGCSAGRLGRWRNATGLPN
jgi:hypothetical protein